MRTYSVRELRVDDETGTEVDVRFRCCTSSRA